MLYDSNLLWFGVHCLASLVFGLGVLLFIFWAWKELKGKRLVNWTIAFLLIGGIVSALTMQYSMGAWGLRVDRMMDGIEWDEMMDDSN